jgi:hypothetical protein
MKKVSRKLLVLCLSVVMALGFTITASANTVISPVTLQAENAALSGGAVVMTDHLNYTGTGFVAGYWNVGATTTFSYTSTYDMTYQVLIYFANGNNADKSLTVYLDGVKYYNNTNFSQSWGWDSWSSEEFMIRLPVGSHTIAFKYDATDSGNINLDRLVINPTQIGYKEAEDAVLSSQVTVNNDRLGYTGTGYAAYNSVGGSVSFNNLYVTKSSDKDVGVLYSNGNGSAKTLSIYVNGVLRVANKSFPATFDWDHWMYTFDTIHLEEGFNNIAYVWTSSDTGDISIDNIKLGVF